MVLINDYIVNILAYTALVTVTFQCLLISNTHFNIIDPHRALFVWKHHDKQNVTLTTPISTTEEDGSTARKLEPRQILPAELRSPSPNDLLAYSSLQETRWSSNLPVALDETLADMSEPFNPNTDVPFYWQIPKAGTTYALSYLSRCLNLTQATRKGQYSDELELKVIEVNGYNYLNVDTTSPEGMDRAKKLGLASSRLADVVVSGYVSSAHRVFTSTNRGRLFALFRHPVDRLASKFYYLQIATWEKTYRPELANMTIEQYARQETLVVGDWMVRMIVNKMNIERQPLVPEDLLMAKEILRKKCLIGLVSHMEESLLRIEKYFGWAVKDLYHRERLSMTGEECKRQYFAGEQKENVHKHPTITPASEAWDLLSKAANYDMQLYSYAVELFQGQSKLFH